MRNNLIFLSHILDVNTPTYGNRDSLEIREPSSIKNGASANSSEWNFSSNHFGTHIDTPKHFDDKGKTLTDYDASYFYSEIIQIMDIPCLSGVLVGEENLPGNIEKETEVLLIRTGYEKFRDQDKYWNDNPGISPGLSLLLRKNYPKLKFLGFDFISLTSWNYRSEGKEAHLNLLSSERINVRPIMIVEDMKLSQLQGNPDWIMISPLLVRGTNGSPVTVTACLS